MLSANLVNIQIVTLNKLNSTMMNLTLWILHCLYAFENQGVIQGYTISRITYFSNFLYLEWDWANQV